MKPLLPLFLLLCGLAPAQTLKVISAKDKSPIPFAYLSIKSNTRELTVMSDEKGMITLTTHFNDTLNYTLQLKSIGFKPFKKNSKGVELATLKVIELIPEQLQLDEVVVTAQYEPTLADKSVQRIKIIDKQKIEQMGAVNLRDVLSNQLNVRLQQDNILGSNMSMQGISGENIKYLIDGVQLIGRLNGSIDLTQINMNNVERIEISEGPLSVQYGTNALAGTINIITKKGIEDRQTFGASAYYESIGTYNVIGDATFSGKNHNLQVSGGRNYFDGWNPTDDLFYLPEAKLADSTRFKKWKPKEQYFASLGYQHPFKKLSFGFKSDYFNEKMVNRGFPRAPYAESSFDDYYYTNRIDNSLHLNTSHFKNWKVSSVSSHNFYKRTKRTVFKDLTNLEEKMASSNDQDTSKFTLFMSRASFIRSKDTAALNYEIGYDINYETALGKRIENRIQSMGDYAVFVTAQYRPYSKLIIKSGLRYANNTNYESPLIPSLNIKWDFATNHHLRASYAKGFRAPTIKELYFYFVDINHNIVGNENLKSENSSNYSLSYNYNTLIKNVNYKLEANLFYNDISNLITLAQTTGTEYTYVNIGEFKTMGAQLSNSINYKNVTTQLGFNYTGRYNQLSESNNLPTFNYSPEVLANLAYRIRKQKTTLSVFYKYNGKLPGYVLLDESIQQTFIEAYQLMDATLNKLFLNERINLVLGCKNIFSVQNIASNVSGGAHSSGSSSIPLSTGRNYFVKLSFNIK
jgi:outer membrane receptor for ferrienterochelin and colicins